MLDRFFRFSSAINGIYQSIQKIEADELTKYGLRGAHAQYLIAMTQYPGGITSAKLTQLIQKDKAAVSRAVMEMEEKGLVLRVNNGEKNYRAPIILTETGEKAALALCERAKLAVELAGGNLDEDMRNNFYKALGIISEKLDVISRTGLPE
ncbi:MAG: winged helix-turn-helix transcriptional regulator [Clostridia bacterium]|nr:winged helix-turn-helix transcriptional regulator [Clostridia bacterium]